MSETTATKAWAGSSIAGAASAGATLLLFWAGPSLGLTPPDQAEATSALRELAIAAGIGLGTGIPAWIAIYQARNRPKPPAGGAGLQAHPAAVLLSAALAWTALLATVALLAACQTAGRVTALADTHVYPTLRTTSCVLSPALVEARRAERYEASGIDARADCTWYPGKTFDQYLAEVEAARTLSDFGRISPGSEASGV